MAYPRVRQFGVRHLPSWYGQLGISLGAVDVPFYFFFIYAYNILAVRPVACLLVPAMIAAIVLGAGRRHGYSLAATLLLGMFFVLY